MFGNNSKDDIRILVGIAALGFPVGHPAHQVRQDIGHHPLGILLREDEDLRADILGVGLIQGQRAGRTVNDTVNHDLDVEKQGAGQVNAKVYGEIQPPDAEGLMALREEHPQDIRAAAAAAAPQGDAHACPRQDAAHQAGRDGILHQGGRRNRNQRQKHGLAEDADYGPDKKASAHRKIGQEEQRDIQHKVNDTGDIRAAHLKIGIAYQQGSQDLADSHDAAAVQIRRHDKGIDAHRIDKHAAHRDQEAHHILALQLPEHIVG